MAGAKADPTLARRQSFPRRYRSRSAPACRRRKRCGVRVPARSGCGHQMGARVDLAGERAARRASADCRMWEARCGLRGHAPLPCEGARMNRRGFALLAVLWVLTALTALTGAGVLVARLGSETTRNRVLLARAEWAREACGEILSARFAADPTTRKLEPIDLGGGTWCRASVDDPAARLNLNTAD